MEDVRPEFSEHLLSDLPLDAPRQEMPWLVNSGPFVPADLQVLFPTSQDHLERTRHAPTRQQASRMIACKGGARTPPPTLDSPR